MRYRDLLLAAVSITAISGVAQAQTALAAAVPSPAADTGPHPSRTQGCRPRVTFSHFVMPATAVSVAVE